MSIPRPDRQRGVTLIELIVFMVIVSVGLAGVLTALNVAVKGSADPLQPKQALAIAEGILEEVLLKDYCDPSLPSAVSISGDLTAGSDVITGIADTSAVATGWQVIGTGVPGSATVSSKTTSTLTLSSKALTTATAVALTAAACESQEASRDLYDDVRDYHNFSQATVTTLAGTSVPGYSVSVSIPSATVAVGGFPAREVTVTVTAPSGRPYTLTGHRMPY